jgi:hypothetical protein
MLIEEGLHAHSPAKEKAPELEIEQVDTLEEITRSKTETPQFTSSKVPDLKSAEEQKQ